MLHLRRSSRFLPCLPSAYLQTSSRLPSGRNYFTKIDFKGCVVVSWWCLLIEEEWIFHNSLHVTQDPITGQCFPFKVSNVEGMGRFVTCPNILSIQTCASVQWTLSMALTTVPWQLQTYVTCGVLFLFMKNHCTMRRSPLQSVNRTIYQNVYLAPHFFPAPLFQMTNIWRKYLITFTFSVYLTTWVMKNHSHN